MAKKVKLGLDQANSSLGNSYRFALIFNGLKIGKVFYFNTNLTQININSTLIFLMLGIDCQIRTAD